MPMKVPDGMNYTLAGIRTASIRASASWTRVLAPTKQKAISRAFAVWMKERTFISLASISLPMPVKPHSAKIIVALIMANRLQGLALR